MIALNIRFALIRKTLGMTTRKFGERLNITGGAVTNMEKGARGNTAYLQKIESKKNKNIISIRKVRQNLK